MVTTRICVVGSRGALQLVSTTPGGVQMAELELWGAASPTAELQRVVTPDGYRRVARPEVGPAVNVAEALRGFGDDIRHGTSTTPTFDDAVRLHQTLDRVAGVGLPQSG